MTFTTRSAWNGYGDLTVDGEDLGWHSEDEARTAAAERGQSLTVVFEDDYNVRNPRREETA